MPHILTVDSNILMSIRLESASLALLKAYNHDNYTVKCLPCGWSRQYQLAELFDAPEYCPRCEFAEEGENAARGVKGVEQLHFSSSDKIPAGVPKEFCVFKDELLVDGSIDLLKIFLEESQYWAGLFIIFGLTLLNYCHNLWIMKWPLKTRSRFIRLYWCCSLTSS